MRIAVCVEDAATREILGKWLRQYCALYDIAPEVAAFQTSEEYLAARRLRMFELLFVGLSGPEGFLSARRMREEDRACKMVYIADTPEYSIRCVHLHFTDYLIRPVEFKSFVRSMKLAGVGA